MRCQSGRLLDPAVHTFAVSGIEQTTCAGNRRSWKGDQTCIMSGRPAESREPLAVEMRRHLSTDLHRAAPLTVYAGRESYTGGMDKRPRGIPNRMTLAHPLLPTVCSPLSTLSTLSSNSPSRIS